MGLQEYEQERREERRTRLLTVILVVLTALGVGAVVLWGLG